MDFETFLDIYVTNRSDELLDRDGIEFRYTAASLLIACSKSDMDQDPEETRVIRRILQTTFGVSDKTIDRLIKFGEDASDEEYLDKITRFINSQFGKRDKYFLLQKLWLVAYADERIEQAEERFIERVAKALDMDELDVSTARAQAEKESVSLG